MPPSLLPDPAPDAPPAGRATMARVRRWAGRALLALLVLVAAFLALVPIGRYLARAGWEEAKILARRRPIVDLVADPATDAATRAKLRLVLETRAFALDSLDFDAGESFTTYSALERDTLVLLLAAARRDTLRAHTWWFPVVGRVPYKGFFDFGAAAAAAAGLERAGLDAYLRPASAFSTLGWFNDPLLSATLRADSVNLANTVIHELVHNTFYAPGQAVFNESFANFVGGRGAERFFRARGDTAAADRAARDWARERQRGAFYTTLRRTIDSAFAAHGTDSLARLRAAAVIYAAARARLVREMGPPGLSPDSLAARAARVQLNNAILLARRAYLTDLDLFDLVYDREGQDVVRATRRIMAIARSDERKPWRALRRWLGVAPRPEDADD